MTQNNDRVLDTMKRWVKGDITTGEADKELELVGVQLPKETRHPGDTVTIIKQEPFYYPQTGKWYQYTDTVRNGKLSCRVCDEIKVK